MSEQVPEYVLGESVAQTIEDAKEHGLSLVAVNVTLLEAVLEKLNENAALKRENEDLRRFLRGVPHGQSLSAGEQDELDDLLTAEEQE